MMLKEKNSRCLDSIRATLERGSEEGGGTREGVGRGGGILETIAFFFCKIIDLLFGQGH